MDPSNFDLFVNIIAEIVYNNKQTELKTYIPSLVKEKEKTLQIMKPNESHQGDMRDSNIVTYRLGNNYEFQYFYIEISNEIEMHYSYKLYSINQKLTNDTTNIELIQSKIKEGKKILILYSKGTNSNDILLSFFKTSEIYYKYSFKYKSIVQPEKEIIPEIELNQLKPEAYFVYSFLTVSFNELFNTTELAEQASYYFYPK